MARAPAPIGGTVQFAPHTDDDVARMLARLRLDRLDQLFDHIPEGVRARGRIELPDGLSEDEVVRRMTALAARNRSDLVCFAGGGAYDHYVPALVPALLSRGELYTSYTPYQPEVSQGVLQALFEYQTVVCTLTGLDVSNASLYDGASAAAEAVSMAVGATGRSRVVVSEGLAPATREVLATFARPRGLAIEAIALDDDGRTPAPDRLPDDVAAYVVAQPNALGVVEDVRAHTAAARAAGARSIVSFDATAAGLLPAPGAQGADLVVGDGLQLGNGLHYGGPSFGFLACREQDVRRLPGRLVGQTVDRRGHRGFVLTLQAREQHIRREKATSNICTNQTLNALAGLLYLVWLGPAGLRELAATCLQRAHDLARRLERVDGVELATRAPFYKEFALRVPGDPHRFVTAVAEEGFLVGPVVADGRAAGSVLVATTERRTADEADGLVEAVRRVAKEAAA